MKKFLLICIGVSLFSICNAQVRFQGQFDVGTVFMDGGVGPAADITAGISIHNSFYVGLESGFGSIFSSAIISDGYDMYNLEIFEGYIPLGINMKGYLSKRTSVRPYINCSLGGFFGVADLDGVNGFRCQAGAGLECRRINIGVGYQVLAGLGTAHCGYVKIGFRF